MNKLFIKSRKTFQKTNYRLHVLLPMHHDVAK
jgi:hypothetical protein